MTSSGKVVVNGSDEPAHAPRARRADEMRDQDPHQFPCRGASPRRTPHRRRSRGPRAPRRSGGCAPLARFLIERRPALVEAPRGGIFENLQQRVHVAIIVFILHAGQGAQAQRIAGAQAAQAADQRLGEPGRVRPFSGCKTPVHSFDQPFLDAARVERHGRNTTPSGFRSDETIGFRPHARHDEHVRGIEQADDLRPLQPAGELHRNLGVRRSNVTGATLPPGAGRAVSGEGHPQGTPDRLMRLRQRVEEIVTALRPIHPADEDEMPGLAGGPRTGQPCRRRDDLGIRAQVRRVNDPPARRRVPSELAAHVLGMRHHGGVLRQQGVPRALPGVIANHRQRAEAAAPPRIEQRQARRSKHTVARLHERQSVRLLAGDARAVIGVGEQHGRRRQQQAPLEVGAQQAMNVDDVGIPGANAIERALARERQRHTAFRQRNWSAVSRLVGFEGVGEVVTPCREQRHHAAEIRLGTSYTAPGPIGEQNPHSLPGASPRPPLPALVGKRRSALNGSKQPRPRQAGRKGYRGGSSRL